MEAKDRQAFRKGLVESHRRRRPLLLPYKRALLWFAAAFVISVGAMRYVQVFRPGFAEQLAQHPFFLIEVASSLLFAPLGAYVALARATPGERIPRWAITGLWILAALLVIGLAAGFTSLAPESSTVGARHACWLEVLVYGSICLLLFAGMVLRGLVRFSWCRGVLFGLIAGLVPASLMQLACMYSPPHGLMFHYLPVVLLVPAGLVVMRLFHR